VPGVVLFADEKTVTLLGDTFLSVTETGEFTQEIHFLFFEK